MEARTFTDEDRRSWYERGRYDSKHERGCLMYPARGGGVVFSCDPPDDWDEDFSLQAARSYINGYNEAGIND